MSKAPQTSRDRWLHTSCLQKTIRRNLPDLAVPSARFLWGWNPRYLMRRLGVIAFEDIGLANLDLIERYLAFAHPILKAGRFGGAEREKVIGFVRAFCASPKSRYLTRITATAMYHPRLKAVTEQARHAILTDKVAVAREETDLLTAHAKALACSPKELGIVLRGEGFDQLADLMHLGNRLGCEGLPMALFATRHEKPVQTIPTTLPPLVMMEGFPDFVFDRHTSKGARALRLFVTKVPELASLPAHVAAWVAYRVLFRLESGFLDREVMFTSDSGVEKVWWETLAVSGAGMDDVMRWKDALHRNLPLLNDCRRIVLGLTADNLSLSAVTNGPA